MAEMVKYVAAGFLDDAEGLIRDFMKENSMEFSAFADVWKKHNFALVYAGRANGKELREFTLEMFQLSVNFLKSSSLLYQVGGTFLLYALYRNQILSPPLKIRITSNLFKTIVSLLEMSRSEKHLSLHYVIGYLVKNSFDFVHCPKLKGPNSIKNEFYNSYIYHPKIQESDVKYELTEIAENNVLQEMDELFTQYEECVQTLNTPYIDATGKHPAFKDLAHRIDKLLNESDNSDEDSCNGIKEVEPPQNQSEKDSAIGSRRALIKAHAFSNPAYHYLSHGENTVSEGIESAAEVAPKPPRPPLRIRRRVRRGKKKVGRPKKCPSEASMSEEDPDQRLLGYSGRRRRRPRGPEFAKIRYYSSADFRECVDLNAPSTSTYVPEQYLFSSDSDYTEQL